MSAPDAPERPRDTERRRATVMFADITGFTALVEKTDAEEAYTVVTGALKLLDGIARRHGASVDKYLGDCIMAVFGVPVAIEDAPRASVNAAIEMIHAMDAYSRERGLPTPLKVHVGINTGLAISGDVSGPVLREFALMGDAVNVAARLKDLAPPGLVYVGAETHRSTRHAFEYRALPPLKLKGKELEVRAFELLSTRERLHRARPSGVRPSPLVGRDALVSSLEDRLSGLSAGSGGGGITSLVAEAGVGKSRLLAELASRAGAQGIAWIEGRSVSVGRTLPFHPFADLLRSWAGITDDDPDTEARDKLGRAIADRLPEAAAEVEPPLASLMGLKLRGEDRKRLRGVEGEAMENVTLRAVKRLLLAIAAGGPVTLVFEDAHWADLSSLQLLDSLLHLSAEAPIHFLVVLRPGYADTGEWLLGRAAELHAGRHQRVDLAPLDRQDARRLLRHLFRAGDIPGEILDRIQEKAAGNPFYLEEVVRSLVDDGAVREDADGLHATERLRDVVIPGSIQEVLMARLDRLPPATRVVVQVAAVTGRSLHRVVMAAVVPPETNLDAQLAELEVAGMLERRDPHGRLWAFRHPLIQDVAYDSILRARREELHRAVAQAIEQHLSDSLPGYHGMLAYHFGLGRDLESAEEYLFKAGDEAARLAAADEALHFFHEAAALYFQLHGEGGDPEKKAALERHMAVARANRGELAQSVEHINRALGYLGQRVPTTRFQIGRAAARGVASVFWHLYLSNRSAKPHAASDRERTVIELMYDRARAQTTTSSTRFVFDSFDAFNRLRSVDPASVPKSGGMYASAVGIFSFGGLSFGVAKRFLDMARPLVREDDVAERFLFGFMSFLHHHLAGDWSAEHEIDESLISATLELGVLWDVTNYLGLLADQRLLQGRWAEAADLIQRVSKIGDLYQYDLARSTVHGLTSFFEMERRRLPEALDAAEIHYNEHGEPLFNLHSLGTKARALVLLGRGDDAAESLRMSDAILARAGLAAPYYRVSTLRARLHAEVAAVAAHAETRGRALRTARRRARRTARAAIRAADKVAARRAETLRLDGRLRFLTGDTRGALRSLERALEAARALGMRPEEARVRAELVTCLEGAGPERRVAREDAVAHLESAKRSFVELGLGWDLAQLTRSHPEAALD